MLLIFIFKWVNQTKIQTFINIKVQVLINKLEFGAATLNDNLKKSRVIKMDKIEVFGRVLSQEEIEHVFLKAKKLQAQNRVYEEELQKFRSVGV